jgi:predicted TIM-barrel fold metal-dependent hydrolase
VVDSHVHFWDASRENWVEGAEKYAKGWIDCFYGYHQLAPPETHWDYEHYLKVSEEDFVKDVFEEGHVDVAIFESTYLKEWYKDGFNTLERNGALARKYPERLIANGRWDPRDGDAGLEQLEREAKEWHQEHPRPQGPDDLAARQGRLRPH